MFSTDSTNQVLFDEDCAVCKGAVQFLSRKDINKTLQFSGLTSSTAKKLEKEGVYRKKINSVILFQEGVMYTSSDAVLRILASLGGVWNLIRVLLLVPKPIRDFVYSVFRDNRHRLEKL